MGDYQNIHYNDFIKNERYQVFKDYNIHFLMVKV